MFRWYETAEECYVYLSDVSCEESDLCSTDEIASWGDRSTAVRFWMSNNEDLTVSNATTYTSGLREELAAALRGSKWFTRSWTLQELLAPCVLRFIDRDWKGVFGSKVSLNKIVSQITGIPNVGFRMAKNMRCVSIAARMCWASQRICTRGEDIAYSLLGIFGVNMPLLYGEGAYRAFLGLQLEILKEHDDESIFAWYPGKLPMSSRKEMRGGLLASSPSDFALPMLTKVTPHGRHTRATRVLYSMTHKGLAIKTTLRPDSDHDGDVPNRYFRMALNCYISKEKIPLSIRLVQLGESSFERILGPANENVRELDREALLKFEQEREIYGTDPLTERLIYIPQSPYPELLARNNTSIAIPGRLYGALAERQMLFEFETNHEAIMNTIPRHERWEES